MRYATSHYRTSKRGGSKHKLWRWRTLPLALVIGFALTLLFSVPIGPFQPSIQRASAHALLVRSDPSADQILQAPPSRVRMWFSEDLNQLTSRAVVIDTTNREVDAGPSQVSSSNPREMDVSLRLIPAGTYIVDWRTQSAEDGHIVGGSFIFRIARPDGTVPPVPAVLPTGHIPGAGGSGGSGTGTLDGPTVLQTVATWLSLLFMTFWVGGLIWETWVLAPGRARDPAVATGAERAAQRFRRLAPYALGFVLVADVGLVLAQTAEIAGEWSGMLSPPLLHAVVFGSRFGTFWWMRQLVAAAALVVTLVATQRGWQEQRQNGQNTPTALLPAIDPAESMDVSDVPDWRRELLAVFRSVPQLPARLVAGWRARSWLGRGECILGALLIIAFAMSGHAAAVSSNEFVYAMSVDLLHLVCNAAWVGGLLYISFVLIPAARHLAPHQRARLLARGMPEFSAVAIVSALVLAATGSLNTTIHLTSIMQFLTTTYGRTLAVKIELFLVMVAISAYHAFFLRPRLARALAATPASAPAAEAQPASAAQTLVGARAAAESATATPAAQALALSADANSDATPTHNQPQVSQSGQTSRDSQLPPRAQRLAERLEDWLGREAMIGAAVLLCVALLAAFAGSLTPPPVGASATHTGAFTQSQTVKGTAITLHVTPDTFGTNTFTVTVKDAQNKPITGASVLIQTNMLDMDMGVQNVQLKAVGPSSPGVYSGQSDLTMAGHWDAKVKVLLPNTQQFILADYRFAATY